MTIPYTRPFARLLAAAIAYRDLAGLDAYASFLAHEAAATAATRQMLGGAEPASTAIPEVQALAERCAKVEGLLAEAAGALEYYADDLHWQKRRGGKPSDVEKDGGDIARAALARIEGNDGGEDGE
jgi:hypothetical protein